MKICAFGLFAAAVVPGAACAQAAKDPAAGQIMVGGNVAQLCVLGMPSRAKVDVGQIAATSKAGVGKMSKINSQTVILPRSFCNFAGSAITVTTTAWVSTDLSAVRPGFAKAVNYTTTVSNWASTPTVATSAATAAGAMPSAISKGATQGTPKIADLTVTLSNFTVPSDLLLTAGTYNGLVVVTLGPAAGGER